MPSRVLIFQGKEHLCDHIEEILVEARHTLHPEYAGFWYNRALDCVCVTAPDDASVLLNEFDPDLVIVDANYPNYMGLAFCMQVTEQSVVSQSSCPILLTAPSDTQKPIDPQFGYDMILRGPVETFDLLDAVEVLLTTN